MGWGRTLLLGDWGLQMNVDEQQHELERLKEQLYRQRSQASGNVEDQIAVLAQENDELKLYIAALVQYLASKGHLQKQEFAKYVMQIDAQDGKNDGKFEGNIFSD